MKRIILYVLVICTGTMLNAQNFSLLKEINTTATSNGISVIGLAATGNTVFYVATDGVNGYELWKSDGTAAGTFMIKDINPGPGNGITQNSISTSSNSFIANNGILYFVANDGSAGNELWRSDGTNAGTYMIKDINPGSISSGPLRFFFHNGLLFFGATDGVSGFELWKSDGTVAGTVLVKDINPGANPGLTASANPYFFTALGSDVYFPANNGASGVEIWKTDGTAAGTVMVKDINPGAVSSITAQKAAVFNNKIYFSASNGSAVNGTELWVSDGTDAGTTMVKDIVSGTGNSFPNNLIEFNGALFFSASTTNNANPDLWKTDGTEAGTILVKSLVADGITIGIGNSTITNEFTIAGSKLFFKISSSPSGAEMYATDGTTAGSGIIADLYPGVNGINPSGLIPFNNNLYFYGTDLALPSKGGILYKSDGTAAGTVPAVTGLTGDVLGLSSNYNVIADNRLYFFGNTIDEGIELWSTDGSSAGTSLAKDANTQKNGTPNSAGNLLGSVVMGGNYYFAATDDENGMELWKSNGTAAGTVLVKDIWPGKGASYPSQFTAYNGMIYFIASTPANGSELWKTDGTEAGTVMIADIAPGAISCNINRINVANNKLLFSAYHPLFGQEFWLSDGTSAGTSLLIDLVPGTGSGVSGTNDAVSIGTDIYLLANIANGNILGIPPSNRLFKFDAVTQTLTDFSPTITAAQDITSIGNTLYITGRNSSGNTILWKSVNGGSVTQVKMLTTSALSAYSLTDCNGKLYFNGSNGAAAGGEPWISDGTDAGTYMIKDINPGTNTSSPHQFVYSGGKVYFTASSIGNLNGEYELWATDGTTAGTYLVKDIQPGATGSRPNGTISIPGNKVLFAANDGVSGYELWQSNGTTAGTIQMPEFNNNGDGVIPNNSIFINFSTDYIYTKLNDGIIFFARSADKGMQLYSGSIAGNYRYVNDNSTTGDIFTAAIGNNTNNGSQTAPFATLTYALSLASEGDTIYVDAGTYVEQVTITKGITIIGAGQSLTTVTNNPAVTLLPAPGSFTELGLIQTGQNIGDVHIRNMTVTPAAGSTPYVPHPVMIQSGGSVRGCTIINGTIFFRIQNAIKTAVVENNTITTEYIGVNFEGSGLTASLLNNTINVTSPFFSVGAFVGADGEGFSPLPQFTAIGNFLNSYVTSGFQVTSNNANITQNNFAGTGLAIQQQSSSNLLNATCNWYGTTNSATIASKMSGNISFNPWLTSGADNNAAPGFQPANGTCSGRTNYYVNDNNLTADVFTTAVGNNANNGSQAAPFATLSYAITQAAADDYIYVDAGAYAEQVIINKGITIIGAGQNLTSFTPPATTLVAAPGPFAEIGLFATTQNIGDVSISHLSINSNNLSQNIIIQSGGVVRNCKLLNGGQGVFFRVDPATNPTPKSAVIEFNQIEPGFIGINCQGTNLTTFITGNTITKASPYYAGIFAGLDFGPVSQLFISNNVFNNYNGVGIQGNSSTGFYNNNSFTGTNGAIAISRGSGNTPNATCNWYGSADQNIVIAQIQGAVNYSPWLTNGTDNSSATGFQPVPSVCNGRQNKYYVNDNSLTGDVFTTAIGNDNTGGIPSAPLATISVALTRAQTGDTIFVDAGTFATPNMNINKSVTILGSNYNVSPNNPADRLAINPIRNTDALITGSTFTISSNDVRLEGLSFNPGAKSQVAIGSLGANNFTFKRNNSTITSNSPFVSLSGPSSTPSGQGSTFGNYLIEDNRFEGQSTTVTSTAITIGSVNDVTVNNNTFITAASATQRSLINSSLIGNAITANYTFSNNISYASRADFFTSIHPVSATFNNNITLQCFRSILLQGNIPASTDIKIRNNYIETDFAEATVAPIQYTCSGTTLTGAIANALIENNTVIQNPSGRTVVPMAIRAQFSGNIVNSLTNIRKNKISFIGDYSLFTNSSVFGISLSGLIQTMNVEENEIAFSGTNLTDAIPATDLSASGVSILSEFGPNIQIPANALMNINGNKISGFKNSISVYDVNNLAPGTYVGYGNLPAGVALTINNNSFTGDAISINNGTIGQQAQASCNWYGSASLQNIMNKVTVQTVAYTPYLTNGTDNDLGTTGFQPMPGSCNNYPINVIVDSYTNVTCNGANNGAINITVSGGSAPYTFTWTKTGDPLFNSTVEDPANFGPGTYHLSITDALGTNLIMDQNGNIITIDVTLTEPPVLTAAGIGTNVSCFNGSDGTATVNVTGGTTPYMYLWSNGATTSSISNLTQGNYTFIVTDVNGCTANANYNVTQPPVLNVTVTGTTASCNGSATANPTGGTSPYTFLWNNGATTQTISNIPPGTYSVVVTDANGCTKSGTITINGSSPINPTTTLVSVGCFGGNNGSITITGTNTGTAPFTYNLNGSPFQASNVFSNLAAGVYIVGVKDANGCSDFVNRTISQPSALVTVALDSTKRPCYGVNSGRIYITAAGPLNKTYSWTGPNGYTSTTQDPNNLAPGEYNLTVTNTNGCTASLTVTLASWPHVTISEVVTDVKCRNELTGAIDISVNGGTGSGFTFTWNGPGTPEPPATEDINNLKAGSYYLSVTDIGSGCVVKDTIIINQPASAVNVTATIPTIITCAGSIATATGSGGVAPYEYSFDGSPYQTANTFTIFTGGDHTVTIRDANGCTKTLIKPVVDGGKDAYETNNSKTQSKLIEVGTVINGRIATAADAADWFKFTTSTAGAYTVSLTHPSAGFAFNLYSTVNNSPALIPVSTTATTKEYNLNAATTYHVQVTGGLSYSCYSMLVSLGAPPVGNRTAPTEIVETPAPPITVKTIEAKLYPNPHQGVFNLQITSPEDAKATIQIITVDGKVILTREVRLQKGNGNIEGFSGLYQSVLFYRIITDNKTLSGKIIGPN